MSVLLQPTWAHWPREPELERMTTQSWWTVGVNVMVRSTTLMVEMIKMVKMIRSPGCLGWWAGHWSSLSSYSLCSRPSTRRWPVCCHDENSDGDFVYKRSFLCFSHRNSYQNWSSQVSDIRKYKAKGWSLRYQYISLILLTLCQMITSVAVSESPIYALVEPIRPCTAVFWFADLQITIDPLPQSKFGLTIHNPENMMTWCFFTRGGTRVHSQLPNECD